MSFRLRPRLSLSVGAVAVALLLSAALAPSATAVAAAPPTSATAVAAPHDKGAADRVSEGKGKKTKKGKGKKRTTTPPPKLRVERPIRPIGTVQATDFGIHSFQGVPDLPARAYRLNCVPLWRMLHPAEGRYNWAPADDLISRAQRMGYTDVLFSFCGTPAWAAKGPVADPSREYWGERSTAAPGNMAHWRDFVRAFVARYADKLSGYEAWNEATAKYLWQGTADELAEMTRHLYEAVRELDPTAKVVSANSQMGEQPAWFRSFFPKYMAGLAARGWPVDVVSIHSYAGHPTNVSVAEGVTKRAEVLAELVAAVKKAGIPDRVQLWDTETNYLGRASTRLQQAMVLRTYLDSWRHGLRRTYWYMWVLKPDEWLGIQMMPGSPGVTAYKTLFDWTVGARFTGCAEDRALQVCVFKRGSQSFRIAYATTYTARQTIRLTAPATVCEPTGAACVTRDKVRVSYMPVKIG